MSYSTFYAAVYMVVRDETGRILLHERAGTDYLPGYWDFPSGHVEDGESFAAAAVRELREETSLRISPDDLQIVHVSINHTDRPYINVMFDVTRWQGKPSITEPHKCSGMDFFHITELPEKLTLGVRNMQRQEFQPDLRADVYIDRDLFESIISAAN